MSKIKTQEDLAATINAVFGGEGSGIKGHISYDTSKYTLAKVGTVKLDYKGKEVSKPVHEVRDEHGNTIATITPKVVTDIHTDGGRLQTGSTSRIEYHGHINPRVPLVSKGTLSPILGPKRGKTLEQSAAVVSRTVENFAPRN